MPPKRTILIDAKGDITESSKQKKARRDDALLSSCRRAIYHLHECFTYVFKVKDLDLACIDTMMAVTGHIWSIYNSAKKITNLYGSPTSAPVGLEKKLTLGEVTIEMPAARQEFHNICKLYGIEFAKTEESRKKRGCLQSQLALIYAFKYKMQENLYLNDKYTTSDKGDERTAVEVTRYGVQPRHYCLLGGANMTPTLQTALRQGLGPATILINLVRCSHQMYQEKWKKAAMECFAGVAGIADAVKLLAGSNGEYQDIVEALCNLATTGICKVNHKGSVPWAALRLILATKDEYRGWVAAVRGGQVDISTQVPRSFVNYPIEEAMTIDTVLKIDYSGKGFWNFMYQLGGRKLSIKSHATAPAGVMVQHVMMSMTETSLDDVAIYKWIFGMDAITRKEYAEAFNARKSKGKGVEITFPKPQKVCKFATAVQSSLGASNREPAIPIKTKSGKSNHVVDQLGTMLESLQSTKGYIVRGGANPADILGTLTRQQSGIHKSITSSSVYTVGTTGWYKTGDDTTSACYGTAIEEVPVLQEKTIFQM